MVRRGPLLVALCALAAAQDVDDDMGGDDGAGMDATGPSPPAADGVSASSCVFKAAGNRFDLSPMKRTDHDFTGTTTGGYTYRFNVCGNTVKLCNAQPAPASKWRGTKCNNLGDPATQSVSLLDSADPGRGLKLKYTQGDICKRQVDGQMEIGSRVITYEVRAPTAAADADADALFSRARSRRAQVACDPREEGRLRLPIKELSMCEYVVQFDSRHACPVGTASGALGGRGWGLIVLMVLCVLLYLGGGIYLNGRTEGKHGVEAIAHIRYWEELPGLVRDGLQFSYTHGRAAAEIGMERSRVLYADLRERYAAYAGVSQLPS